MRVLRKGFHFVRDRDFGELAAAMAYTTTLSIIPLLAISYSVFKRVGGLDQILDKLTPVLIGTLAVGTGSQFMEKFATVLHRASGKTLSLIGFLVLAYTSTRLFSQLEKGVQRIWGLPKRRSIQHRLIVYAIGLVGIPVGLAILLGLTGQSLLKGESLRTIQFISLGLVFVLVFSINKWLPHRTVHYISATLASLFVVVGFVVLQISFLTVAKHLLFINKIYGSFASIPIFLIWLLWSWKLFFFGVSLCAGIEKRVYPSS